MAGEIYVGVEDSGEITGLHRDHGDPTRLAALIANKTVPSVRCASRSLNMKPNPYCVLLCLGVWQLYPLQVEKCYAEESKQTVRPKAPPSTPMKLLRDCRTYGFWIFLPSLYRVLSLTILTRWRGSDCEVYCEATGEDRIY